MIELISSSTLNTIASLFLSNHRLGQNPRVDFTFLLKQEEEQQQQEQDSHNLGLKMGLTLVQTVL